LTTSTDTTLDYGFMLKKAIGDNVGAVVPDWLSEDLDDVVLQPANPQSQLRAERDAWIRLIVRLIKAAKATPAFGGVDVDVTQPLRRV
jgi:hypothetical protein